MTQQTGWLAQKWWPIAVITAIAALAYLRLGHATSLNKIDWMGIQELDWAIAQLESKVRYVCVGEMAFDLGEGDAPLLLGTDRIVIVDEEIKKRCLLSGVPFIEDASMLVSATMPQNGTGATLIGLDADPQTAFNTTRENLKRIGWVESGGSASLHQQHPDFKGAWYVRQSAWMLLVSFNSPHHKESMVLMVGQQHPNKGMTK